MATSLLWLRNPHRYLSAAVNSQIPYWVFDRSAHHDPKGLADQTFDGRGYIVTVIGKRRAVTFDRNTSAENPLHTYDVVTPDDVGVCSEDAVGVVRVEHEPDLTAMKGHRGYLHLTGATTFSMAFGRDFRSADFDFSTVPPGKILLPGGGYIDLISAKYFSKWFDLIGYSWQEMDNPKTVRQFNISAAQWAAKNFTNPKAQVEIVEYLDMSKFSLGLVPEVHWLQRSGRPMKAPERGNPQLGDKYYCGSCRFASVCSSYREGAVCSLSVKGKALVDKFGSRNANEIIDGLTDLLVDGVTRYEKGRKSEKKEGVIDPNVSAIHGQLFRSGIALAKLLDPALRSAAIQINTQGVTVAAGGTPQQLAAEARQKMLGAGIAEVDITTAMTLNLIRDGCTDTAVAQMVETLSRSKAIEATVKP